MKLLFTICACLSFLSASAEILETAHFRMIEDYDDNHTLFIFDIDDTLLLPVQTLGTDVWFQHRFNQFKNETSDREFALDQALAEWEAVRHITKVKVVEEGTEAIVERMQNRGCPIMGLTTQGLALTTRTIHQLQSIGIDLSRTAPWSEDVYFLNPIGVLYRKGILFTSGTAKGEALLKFLDAAQIHPHRILFINDKESHLQDVKKSLEKRGIEFIGLRYSYSDERVSRFNPEVTEVQRIYSTLDHILTDAEAESLYEQILEDSRQTPSAQREDRGTEDTECSLYAGA